MNNIIAITIGDINGIGIEILINAWKKNKIKKFILFTDIVRLKKLIKKKKINLKFNIIKNKNKNLKLDYRKINIFSYNSNSDEEQFITVPVKDARQMLFRTCHPTINKQDECLKEGIAKKIDNVTDYMVKNYTLNNYPHSFEFVNIENE